MQINMANTVIYNRWAEPEPLGVTAEQPEDYPLNALPAALLDAAREVSRFNKVPVVSPAVVGISVAATAIGRRAVVIEKPGLIHNLALFHVLLAPSGERKSPVFKHMAAPLEKYEEDHHADWKTKCGEIEAANAIAEKMAKSLESEAAKEITERDRDRLINLISKERGRIRDLPPSPRLYSTDTTEERLFQQLHEREGTFAILSGEGRPVIDAIIGRRSGEGFTGDAIYLAGISGDSITRDRVGGGKYGPESRKIPHPMLNVCVMVQPDKYYEAARHPSLRSSGALARIWPVRLPSLIGSRLEADHEPGLDENQLDQYYQTVRSILDTEPRRDDDGNIVPHRILLGPDAAMARREWHNIIEAMMGDGCELDDVRDIGAKTVSATVKAAGIIHIIQNPEWLSSSESEISFATWKSAQLIGEYHLGEAIRIQRVAGENGKLHNAQRVLKWLSEKKTQKFTRRDLMQYGPRSTRPKILAIEACAILGDHGYIRSIEGQATTYEVHPDVAGVAGVATLSA